MASNRVSNHISKKGLAVALSRLEGFSNAKVELEQYPTESEIAAELLWHAHLHGNISGRDVVDLGAGTGILAVGAAVLGAASVLAVEKDETAITILQKNLALYETSQIRVLHHDIKDWYGTADTVVMNPPFGTKKKHADKLFLEKAVATAPVLYTIHKATTERFITAFCRDHNLRIAWSVEREFPLKKSMPHHTKRREKVAVKLYRLEREQQEERSV